MAISNQAVGPGKIAGGGGQVVGAGPSGALADNSLFVIPVKATVNAPTIAEGALTYISANLNGQLRTTGAGTSMADNSAFTVSVSSLTPAGFLVDETGTGTVTEDFVGAARIDASRRQLIRIVGATDANRVDVTGSGSMLADRKVDWSISHEPAANAQATITKAAGSGAQRHVCTTLSATIAATGVPSAVEVAVRLRDGASGGGTVLWAGVTALQAVNGDRAGFVLGGLRIEGSAATAMTLEFSAAGGANTIESVALTGYTYTP